ncbi:twin-arginine translocase TatA/TatE family subunit [Candidatus Magnetominusculus dajiuhuensis]|uniref:twin-arginine translocase TatA/TatE family subunit n=1 Tax=Candidatus Magnetominusculus dajiuhuensis TaxID=3137712 RepID=UPI0019DE7E02|nr:twin-arginine translocase TatA/TatE family subunit [Nitrospirota bacterium]
MNFLTIPHLLVILVVVLVLFGGQRLPELGKGMGAFIKNLKKGMSDHDEIDVAPKAPEAAPGAAKEEKAAK